MPRIAPVTPPYAADVQAALDKWMPPGSPFPPLALFRTIARHPMLRDRMRPLGAGLLAHGTLPPRVRELLILRTCARCDARYEWEVHVTAFAAAAGLDDAAIRATVDRVPGSLAALDDDDRLVMSVADGLHDTADLPQSLFAAIVARFGELALLEMVAVVGFYHLIGFMIRAAKVEREPWAETFPAEPTTSDAVHAGSCLCGRVRYQVTADLGDFGYCHCTSCRKASGSAHAANAPIDRDRVRFIAGRTALREFESSPGKFRAFCSQCGSPLYAYVAASPDVLRLRLGSLDTPFTKQPRAHTFVSDKASWEPIDDPLPQFAEWADRAVLGQRGTRRG